ncbi:870_t:CDS:2, partial [Racocetra persica]
VSELVNIKHRDWSDNSLRIQGKGNKVRYVLLPPFLVKYISLGSKGYLFTNQGGRKILTDKVREIIRERTKLAGLKKWVSPHTFRRSFATLLDRKRVRMTTIQKLLGHSNLETTSQYIHNDYESLYADYRSIKPKTTRKEENGKPESKNVEPCSHCPELERQIKELEKQLDAVATLPATYIDEFYQKGTEQTETINRLKEKLREKDKEKQQLIQKYSKGENQAQNKGNYQQIPQQSHFTSLFYDKEHKKFFETLKINGPEGQVPKQYLTAKLGTPQTELQQNLLFELVKKINSYYTEENHQSTTAYSLLGQVQEIAEKKFKEGKRRGQIFYSIRLSEPKGEKFRALKEDLSPEK